MGTPYVGEIRIFAGNFPPNGWAFCSGQLMSISENDVLFNLIGTTYGGDGQETFALPNLQGRVPIHFGTGAGSPTYVQGEMGGVETVTLTTQQTPIHTHAVLASGDGAGSPTPDGQLYARSSTDVFTSQVTVTPMNSQDISPVGGNQPHENMQPFLCLNFIISLFGIYPSQT